MNSVKVTPKTLIDMKRNGRKIAMITAYDYPTARIVDQSGVDIILVGDSLGIFMHGLDDTKYVDLEDIVHHCRVVSRAAIRALTVGDMPFGTYLNEDIALINAARIIKEGGVDSVKLEGGREVVDIVHSLTRSGINVMGHIGFTPQRAIESSTFPVQGLESNAAEAIIEDAIELERAGAYALVLEFVSAEVSKIVSEELEIPVIGIGSGPYCDGQVLIFHDVVGLREGKSPAYAKKYIDLQEIVKDAVARYVKDVRDGLFPSRGNYLNMSEEEYMKLVNLLKKKLGEGKSYGLI